MTTLGNIDELNTTEYARETAYDLALTFRKYLAACVTAETSVDALSRVCSHLATATQHNPACAQASPSLSSRAS